VLVSTKSAHAQEAPPAPVAPVAPTAPPPASESETKVPWSGPAGTGVSFGYENGLWGNAWVQGVRVKIPLHQRFGVALRPLALQHVAGGGDYRADLGGRVEIYGASPVYLNFARIYGGGGVQVFQAVTGVSDAKPYFGGGGHFGFEFFLNQRMSFFAEIGGTSGAQDNFGTGGTAMAGLTWYPWSSAKEGHVAASVH
jgi:hypothetical protein